jgi:hypothetical protein
MCRKLRVLFERFSNQPGAVMLFSNIYIPLPILMDYEDLIWLYFYDMEKYGAAEEQTFEAYVRNAKTVDVMEDIQAIGQLYLQSDSVEYWAGDAIDNFIEMLFTTKKENGFEDNNTFELLNKQIAALSEDIQAAAKKGTKEYGGKLNLYISELGFNSQQIHFTANNLNSVLWMNVMEPMVLITADKVFYQGMRADLERHAKMLTE